MIIGFIGSEKTLEPEQMQTIRTLLLRLKPNCILRTSTLTENFSFHQLQLQVLAKTRPKIYVVDPEDLQYSINNNFDTIDCKSEQDAYSKIIEASDLTLFPVYNKNRSQQSIAIDYAFDHLKRHWIINRDGKIYKRVN